MRKRTALAAALKLHSSSAYISSRPYASLNPYNGCKIQNGRCHQTVIFGKENDEDDEWLDLNAPIDFTDLENKILDRDAMNMGWIRFREPPKKGQSVEPLTADELERYRSRTRRIQNEETKQRFTDKWFSFLSPLMTFLVPQNVRSRGRVRSANFVSNNIISGPDSGRNLLVLLNVVAFTYQLVTAVQYLPGFNRILAASISGDAVSAASLANVHQWTRSDVVLRALASAGVGIYSARGIAAHSMGPFFIDFAHQPYPLSYYQRHRYLTSGFLHGSLVHLGLNMKAILSLPRWLENSIGKSVYLSAYFVAIVTGNMAHTFSTLGNMPSRLSSSLAIGASGGVCGLYGLMFASLWRMDNSAAASYVFKQMLWLVTFGYMMPNVSNAAHIGGFLGGALVGYLFGPGYFRSSGRGLDNMDPEFRRVVGAGKL